MASTFFPLDVYDAGWLQCYESAVGQDAQIKLEEMNTFEDLLYRCTVSQPTFNSFLDIGTCTGRYLRWAAQNGFETIVGIDSSVDAIQYCSKALTFTPELHCLDITSVSEQKLQSFLGRQFDLITIMFGTINHFDDIEQLEIIRRMCRILSENGRLIISSWMQGKCGFSLYENSTARLLSTHQISINKISQMASLTDLELIDSSETSSHRLFSLMRHQE
jgi:SAM-dependent methyltransferase